MANVTERRFTAELIASARREPSTGSRLLSFVAVQMNIDSERISDYAPWQHTVSEHQARIQQYLGLRPFDLDESNALERFACEESCRLEQTAPLLARAQEFLKERRVVFPTESAYCVLSESRRSWRTRAS